MRTILGLLLLLGVCAACASPAATPRDAAGDDDDCNGLVDEMPQRGPDGGLVPCPTRSP